MYLIAFFPHGLFSYKRIHSEFAAKPQSFGRNRSREVGTMSQPHSSSTTGTDESHYYITWLALAQGTSDGICGPSPGFRVTQWIWQTHPTNSDFHKNMKDFIHIMEQW